jgi:hypothetical protein
VIEPSDEPLHNGAMNVPDPVTPAFAAMVVVAVVAQRLFAVTVTV